MRTEKAIEHMKSYKKMHTDDYFDLAIKALEKQIPKEIIKSSFEVAFCPSCKKSVWQNKDESQYCFRCGQALKWGD